jgi:hypothetical protein
MRSFTRVSVLMGPPSLIFWSSATVACSVGSQRLEYHAISKKALHKQGPVPTDHGKAACENAEPAQLVYQ